jgi:hypothetical protein
MALYAIVKLLFDAMANSHSLVLFKRRVCKKLLCLSLTLTEAMNCTYLCLYYNMAFGAFIDSSDFIYMERKGKEIRTADSNTYSVSVTIIPSLCLLLTSHGYRY